ncbi:hypothetical protein Tco_0982734, partial [Tanacetum coccineum]
MMTGTKFDIEKFDGMNDFGLWQVLWEITKETTAAGIWKKLKTLYIKKSLANRLYLKKKLYTFHMHSGKRHSEYIDEFNKLILRLEVLNHSGDPSNKVLLLFGVLIRVHLGVILLHLVRVGDLGLISVYLWSFIHSNK